MASQKKWERAEEDTKLRLSSRRDVSVAERYGHYWQSTQRFVSKQGGTFIPSLPSPDCSTPFAGVGTYFFVGICAGVSVLKYFCQHSISLRDWSNAEPQTYFEVCLVILMLPGIYIQMCTEESKNDRTEEEELAKLAERARSWSLRQSRRMSSIYLSDTDDETTVKRRSWASSFADCDPRRKILRYFDDVANEGVRKTYESSVSKDAANLLLRAFPKSSVFSVWRPTSRDAIRKLMTGEGTGKGLNIKGKSSKEGCCSGYVPFIQIHSEEDKDRIRPLERDETLRIYFKNVAQREEAVADLASVAKEMECAVIEAKERHAGQRVDADARIQAMFTINKFDTDPVTDSYTKESPYVGRIESPRPGIEIPERLFWEAFVVRKDISRKGKFASGRPSTPAFMDMNFATMRNAKNEAASSRPVILQMGPHLCPQTLVIAYEENNRILPVVSDFDCFLVGTRNFHFTEPLPEDQIDVLNWMLDNIEDVLRTPTSEESWTSRWLEVLKASAVQGFYPKIPPLGFGDPTSYVIMEQAVGRLSGNGAVRHGAECFNYYFPQQLDDEFLIISDLFPGKVPWKYVNRTELKDILLKFANQGFTFPINPKWILCDKGWKSLFDKLIQSQNPTVKESIDVWYPPAVRERLVDISNRFPNGFQAKESTAAQEAEAKVNDDMVEFELEHYITMHTRTLFEKIGGDVALEAAIDEFYRRVLGDPLLSPFFKGVNMVWLKNHQRRFFKMAFTRIPASVDVSGILLEKHARFFGDGLNTLHFDSVCSHLIETLHHLNIPEDMITDATDIVLPLRSVFEKGANASAKSRPQ